MKVCLLNDSFPPLIDGVANVAYNYACHLQDDHKADILVGTPKYPKLNYDNHPFPVVAYRSLNIGKLVEGYRAGNPFSEKSISQMTRFAPDIIHTHCPAVSTIVARLLREGTDAPLVFTYHTKFDVDIRRSFRAERLVKQGIKFIIGNIEACDEVWTVSRGAGENLEELGYEGEWTVMPNGVDFQKGRVDDEAVLAATGNYDLPENVPVYLFVGRMMNYKGLPVILDALRVLDSEGKDFRMVFVGKGDDEDKVKDKAREYGLLDNPSGTDKCIFTGPVYDRDELRAWNTRADLFFFLSTYDTNGLVVREAAACGLASVLVKGSCAAEDVTDGRNGFLIEENAEALAAFLLEHGDDLSVLRETGQHAMDEIYQSWKDCVSLAYDRYRVILEKKETGCYAVKRKGIGNRFFAGTALGMHEKDRIRQFGKAVFRSLQNTTLGMKDNVAELGLTAKEKLTSFRSEEE